MSKLELSVFYGSDFNGQRIIKLKEDGKKWKPLNKRGVGGLGPAWGSALGTSGPETQLRNPSSSQSTDDRLITGAATYGTGTTAGAHALMTTGGRSAGGHGQLLTKAGEVDYRGKGGKSFKPGYYQKTIDTVTGGQLRTGTAANTGKTGKAIKVAKFGGKKVPVVGALITAAFTLSDVKKRGEDLIDAEASGDASGLARPMRDPVWYSKASWKNAHVGEKSIESQFKY